MDLDQIDAVMQSLLDASAAIPVPKANVSAREFYLAIGQRDGLLQAWDILRAAKYDLIRSQALAS